MTIYKKMDDAQAKINKLRPFEGEMLKQLQATYRIGLTWSSNALEGNTLSISETKVLLEDGLTAGGKPLRDTLEAVGHADACDFMFTLLGKREIAGEFCGFSHAGSLLFRQFAVEYFCHSILKLLHGFERGEFKRNLFEVATFLHLFNRLRGFLWGRRCSVNAV